MPSDPPTAPRVLTVPGRGRASRGGGRGAAREAPPRGERTRPAPAPNAEPERLIADILATSKPIVERIACTRLLAAQLRDATPAGRERLLGAVAPRAQALCQAAWSGSHAQLSPDLGKFLGDLVGHLSRAHSRPLSAAAGPVCEWALSAAQAPRAGPAAVQASALQALSRGLGGASEFILARYATASLLLCVKLLESDSTRPELLASICDLVAQAAKHTPSLKAQFRNLVDLLLGWGLDPIVPVAARPRLCLALAACREGWLASEPWSVKVARGLAADRGWAGGSGAFLARLCCALPVCLALAAVPGRRAFVQGLCADKLALARRVFAGASADERLELVRLVDQLKPMFEDPGSERSAGARDSEMCSLPLLISVSPVAWSHSMIGPQARQLPGACGAASPPELRWALTLHDTCSARGLAISLGRLLCDLLKDAEATRLDGSSKQVCEQLTAAIVDNLRNIAPLLPASSLVVELVSACWQGPTEQVVGVLLGAPALLDDQRLLYGLVDCFSAAIAVGHEGRAVPVAAAVCSGLERCLLPKDGPLVLGTLRAAQLLFKMAGSNASQPQALTAALIRVIICAAKGVQRCCARAEPSELPTLQQMLLDDLLVRHGHSESLNAVLAWIGASGQGALDPSLGDAILRCGVHALQSETAAEQTLQLVLTALAARGWREGPRTRMCQRKPALLASAWMLAAQALSHTDSEVRSAAKRLASSAGLLAHAALSSADWEGAFPAASWRVLGGSGSDCSTEPAGAPSSAHKPFLDARTGALLLAWLSNAQAPAAIVVAAPRAGAAQRPRNGLPLSAQSEAPLTAPPLGVDRLLLRALRSRPGAERHSTDAALLRAAVRELVEAGLGAGYPGLSLGTFLSALEAAVQRVVACLAAVDPAAAAPKRQSGLVAEHRCRGRLLLDILFALEQHRSATGTVERPGPARGLGMSPSRSASPARDRTAAQSVGAFLTRVRSLTLQLAEALAADGHIAFHGRQMLLDIRAERLKEKRSAAAKESGSVTVNPPRPAEQATAPAKGRKETPGGRGAAPTILARPVAAPSRPAAEPTRPKLLRRTPSAPAMEATDAAEATRSRSSSPAVVGGVPDKSRPHELLLRSLTHAAVRCLDPGLLAGLDAELAPGEDRVAKLWLAAARAHAAERYELALARYGAINSEGAAVGVDANQAAGPDTIPSSLQDLAYQCSAAIGDTESLGKWPVPSRSSSAELCKACRDLAEWASTAFVPEDGVAGPRARDQGLRVLKTVVASLRGAGPSSVRPAPPPDEILSALSPDSLPSAREFSAMACVAGFAEGGGALSHGGSVLCGALRSVTAPSLAPALSLLAAERAPGPPNDMAASTLAVAATAVRTGNPKIAQRLIEALSDDLAPLQSLRRELVLLQAGDKASGPMWTRLRPSFDACCRGGGALEALQSLLPLGASLWEDSAARPAVLESLKRQHAEEEEPALGQLWQSYSYWLVDQPTESAKAEALLALCGALRASGASADAREPALRLVSLLRGRVDASGGASALTEPELSACLNIPASIWLPILRPLLTVPNEALLIALLRQIGAIAPQQVALALHALPSAQRLAARAWPKADDHVRACIRNVQAWARRVEDLALLWEERAYALVTELAAALSRAAKSHAGAVVQGASLAALVVLFRQGLRALCAERDLVSSEPDASSRRGLIHQALTQLSDELVKLLAASIGQGDQAALASARAAAVAAMRRIAPALPVGDVGVGDLLWSERSDLDGAKSGPLAEFQRQTAAAAVPLDWTCADGTTIAAFAPRVRVLTTKTRPKVVTLLGSDGLERRFLLKGSEDVGMHAGILSALDLASRAAAAEDARLAGVASSYRFMVLGPTTGLIEWLGDAASFYELYNAAVAGVGADGGNRAHPSQPARPVELYRRALRAVGVDPARTPRKSWPADRVLAAFRRLQRASPGEALSDALLAAAAGPDAWWRAQGRFARCTGLLSVRDWLFGIGDRHLDNTLLVAQTGACCPIDFDVLFDRGQRLAVPERVPFRLTRCMLRALGPAGVAGPFGEACCAALAGARRKKAPLLDCLAQELSHAADASLRAVHLEAVATERAASVVALWQRRLGAQLALLRLRRLDLVDAEARLHRGLAVADKRLAALGALAEAVDRASADLLGGSSEPRRRELELKNALDSLGAAERAERELRQAYEGSLADAVRAAEAAKASLEAWPAVRDRACAALTALAPEGAGDVLLSSLAAMDPALAPPLSLAAIFAGGQTAWFASAAARAAGVDSQLTRLLVERAQAALALADGLARLRDCLGAAPAERVVRAARAPGEEESEAAILRAMCEVLEQLERAGQSASGSDAAASESADLNGPDASDRQRALQASTDKLRMLLVREGSRALGPGEQGDTSGVPGSLTLLEDIREAYASRATAASEEGRRLAEGAQCEEARAALAERCRCADAGAIQAALAAHAADLLSGSLPQISDSEEPCLDNAVRASQRLVLGWASLLVQVQSVGVAQIFSIGRLEWVSRAVQALDTAVVALAELRLAVAAGIDEEAAKAAYARFIDATRSLSAADAPAAAGRDLQSVWSQAHAGDPRALLQHLEACLAVAFAGNFVASLRDALSKSHKSLTASLEGLGNSEAQAAAVIGSEPLRPERELVRFMDFDPTAAGAGMALEDEEDALGLYGDLEPEDGAEADGDKTEDDDAPAWLDPSLQTRPTDLMEEEDSDLSPLEEGDDDNEACAQNQVHASCSPSILATSREPAVALHSPEARQLAAQLARCQDLLGQAAEAEATAHVGRLVAAAPRERLDPGSIATGARDCVPPDLVAELTASVDALGQVEGRLREWAAADAETQASLLARGKGASQEVQGRVQAALRARQGWLRSASGASGALGTLTMTILAPWTRVESEARLDTITSSRAVITALAAAAAAHERCLAAAQALQEAKTRAEQQKRARAEREAANARLRASLRELSGSLGQATRAVSKASLELEEISADTALQELRQALELGLWAAGGRHVDAERLALQLEHLLGLRAFCHTKLTTWMRELEAALKQAGQGSRVASDEAAGTLLELAGCPVATQLRALVAALGITTADEMPRVEAVVGPLTRELQAPQELGHLSLSSGLVKDLDLVAARDWTALKGCGSSALVSDTAHQSAHAPTGLFPPSVLTPDERRAACASVLARVEGRLSNDVPVRTRVRALIRLATDPAALAGMFEGWMAWV